MALRRGQNVQSTRVEQGPRLVVEPGEEVQDVQVFAPTRIDRIARSVIGRLRIARLRQQELVEILLAVGGLLEILERKGAAVVPELRVHGFGYVLATLRAVRDPGRRGTRRGGGTARKVRAAAPRRK